MTHCISAVARSRAFLAIAGFLLFLGAPAHAEGDGHHEDNDAPGAPVVAPPLPSNNIVACFGANTTDPLANCTGTSSVLQSVTFGLSNVAQSTGGGGAGAGKVVFSALSFTKKLDKSSTVLFGDALSGTAIANVSVGFYDTAGKVTQVFVIRLVQVESITFSDAIAPGGEPTEQVTLRYGALLETL